MSNLEIHCPYCSSMVHVRPENLGNLLQCPGCPGKFRVPSDLASSAATVAEPTHNSPNGQSSAGNSGSNHAAGSRSGHLSNGNIGRQAGGRQAGGRSYGGGQSGRSRGSVQRPPAQMPVGAGYSAYAYPNHSANQNQNMVLVVGGVVIGVILVLFVAMLVVLGSGQLGRDLGAPLNNVANQQFDTPTTKEPQQSEENEQPAAQIVEDRSIHRTDDGKVGFTWDPGVKNNIRGSATESGSNDDDDDMSGGFRSSPTDYGGARPPRTRTPQSSTSKELGFN